MADRGAIGPKIFSTEPIRTENRTVETIAETHEPLPLLPPLAPLQSDRIADGIAERWKIELGRTPVFGARAVDGTALPSVRRCADGLTISELMGDLHRREMPVLADPKSVERWMRSIGLRTSTKSGKLLATELRRSAQEGFDQKLSWELPGAEGMMVPKRPFSSFTRHVIADVLSLGADRGKIDLHRLRSEYGGDVDKLIGWIGARKLGPRLKHYEDAPFERRFVEPQIGAFPRLRQAIIAEQADADRDMPLLREVTERFGFDVSNDIAMVRQHGFRSVLDLAGEIAGRSTIVDKSYSMSLPVKLLQDDMVNYVVLDDRGGLINHFELGLRGESGPVSQWGALLRTLKMGEEKPADRFLLLDEGGQLVVAMHEFLGKSFPPDSFSGSPNHYGFGDRATLTKSIAAVEHTTDGIRHILEAIGEANLQFSVVNAALSPIKALMAAVIEAWSVVEEIERNVQDLIAQGIDVKRSALVVGYGAMGSMIARLLKERGYEVVIKEKEPEKVRGFQVYDEIPDQLDVGMVVGTTGLPWFDEREAQKLKSGTLLFSTSSSTKEFPFQRSGGYELQNQRDDQFRTIPRAEFQGRTILLGNESYDRTHWNRVVKSKDGHELLLMNAGYPIDFTGAPESIAGIYIQLVRSIMLLASFQARNLEEGPPRLVDLDREGQRFIATRWMEMVNELDPPLPKEVKTLLDEAYAETLRRL